MATYNGDKYVREQIDSILLQLKENDELIISDDGSSDQTLKIIKSYQDTRIKILINETSKHGFVGNFENALNHSTGDIIFFSDQDDIWFSNKISKSIELIKSNNFDIFINNCIITNHDLSNIGSKYFSKKHNPVKNGVIGNLISNCWLGCCMAITSNALKQVLPFPNHIIAHDYWIGIFGNAKLYCGYYDDPLQYYRRHDGTTTPSGAKSTLPILFRIKFRIQILNALLRKLFLE